MNNCPGTASSNVAIVCGVNVCRDNYSQRENRLPIAYEDKKYWASGCWFFPGSTLLIKRELFLTLNGFDPNHKRLEDYDFFLRFSNLDGKILVTNDFLCCINRSPHASCRAVVYSCITVVKKHWRLIHDINHWRYMLGYLFLEIGATAFYSKNYIIALPTLLLSFVLVPRLHIQIQKWWSK